MTRNQIKQRVEKSIRDNIRLKFNSGNPMNVGYEDAAEEIMKLWDKGFVYNLPERRADYDCD